MSWWQTLSDGARRASEASGALGTQAAAAWQSSSEYVNAAARDLGNKSAEATAALREAALQRQREIEAEEQRVGRNAFEPVRERVLALSETEQAVSAPPPDDAEFSIDIVAETPNALSMLDEDPRLAALRFKLVPSAMRDEEFWRNYFYRVHMVRSSFPVEDVDEDEDAGEAGDGAGEGDRHSHGGTESGRAPEARVELPAWHGGGERGGEGQRKGPSPPSGEEDSFVRVARPAERPSAGRGAREGEEAEEEGEDEEEDLALAFASDEVEAEMEGQTASTAHTVPEHALLHMRGQLGLGGSGGAGKADTGEKGDGDDAATGAAEDRGDGVGEGDGVEEDLELDWELEGLDDYGGADEGEVDEDEHAELEAAISAELGE